MARHTSPSNQPLLTFFWKKWHKEGESASLQNKVFNNVYLHQRILETATAHPANYNYYNYRFNLVTWRSSFISSLHDTEITFHTSQHNRNRFINDLNMSEIQNPVDIRNLLLLNGLSNAKARPLHDCAGFLINYTHLPSWLRKNFEKGLLCGFIPVTVYNSDSKLAKCD